MKNLIEEATLIFLCSKRMQYSLIAGVISFITISLLGEWIVSGIQLQGMFSPLTEVIQTKVHHRYEQVAFGSMVSFFLLAIRFYQKDKKRIWYQ